MVDPEDNGEMPRIDTVVLPGAPRDTTWKPGM